MIGLLLFAVNLAATEPFVAADDTSPGAAAVRPLPAEVPATPTATPAPEVKTTPPSATDLVLCTAASLPGTVGKCAGMKDPPPPLDTRTFWTVVISGSVALTQVTAGLLTLYLDPPPLGK